MPDSSWGFEAKSFEEIITAASLASGGDDITMKITADQLQGMVKELLAIENLIGECHQLCDEAGIPRVSNKGMDGLHERLKFLKR